MISALVLTYQEERSLPGCLDALAWCDDVLVLDSFSTDATVSIARQRGVRVMQRTFDDFAGQRNYGLACGQLRHDWVLHLDADEIVTPALRDEMVSIVATTPLEAFRVASRLMFEGAWLRRAGMYPTYQVRLGRRERLTFEQVGHGQRETLAPDRIGTLREPLLHYAFAKGLDDWYAKHERYADAEARRNVDAQRAPADWRGPFTRDPVERRRALKTLAARAPCRPALRFLYMYLWRRGILDGRAGFTYCRLLAAYERRTVLKERELRRERHA